MDVVAPEPARPASIASSTSATSLASLSTQASSYAPPLGYVLPRGAKASDYDLSSEEPVEIWAKNKLVVRLASLRAQAHPPDPEGARGVGGRARGAG